MTSNSLSELLLGSSSELSVEEGEKEGLFLPSLWLLRVDRESSRALLRRFGLVFALAALVIGLEF